MPIGCLLRESGYGCCRGETKKGEIPTKRHALAEVRRGNLHSSCSQVCYTGERLHLKPSGRAQHVLGFREIKSASVLQFVEIRSIWNTCVDSQHHGMCEAGRDPWRPPAPSPAQAGPPRAGCPGPRWLLEIPKEETPPLSGQPVPGLLTRTAQKGCLGLRGSLLSSTLCPVPLVLALGTKCPSVCNIAGKINKTK